MANIEMNNVNSGLGNNVMDFLAKNNVPFVMDDKGLEIDMSSMDETQLGELLNLLTPEEGK